MGLINIIRVLNIASEAVEIIDKDTAFSIDSIVDNSPYYHFSGSYLQNPINKKVIYIYGKSSTHYYDANRAITVRQSTDNGVTFGSEISLYTAAGIYGVQDVCAGYGADGRLHFFWNETDPVTPTSDISLHYGYSDDDGTTLNGIVEITTPSDTLDGVSSYINMIENNGVLLKPYYKFQTWGDLSTTAIYLLRSTDYGANWTTITIDAPNSLTYNEVCIVGLGGNNLLCLVRDETLRGYEQFQSTDNGLTWTDHGKAQWSEDFGNRSAPASLRSITIKGQAVIAAYWTNRYDGKYNVIYGKASDLISNNINGWNANTKLNLIEKVESPVTSNVNGYQNMVHFNRTLEGRGIWYDDVALTTTNTYYYTLPTTHYDSLVNELGL